MGGQNTGNIGNFKSIAEIRKAQRDADAKKKAQEKKNAAGLRKSIKKNKKKGK